MRNLRLFIFIMLGFGSAAQAQYLGLNLRGDVGLKGGSLPNPGLYLISPLYYRNDYSGVRGPNGEVIGKSELDINLFTVPGVALVLPKKVLGASLGFQVVPIILNKRLSVASLNATGSTGYGFSDMFFQPLRLGWNTKRADISAGYAFFAPTGGSYGLDMWVHELSAGTTLYMDAKKSWHVSGLASYDINQKKRSQDIKVGQILTVEGGAGKTFLKGAGNAGLAYVAQWKMTHDSGSDIPKVLPITNGRAFGLGPEISVPVFAKGKSVVIVGFRYLWEFGAKTNFEGQTLVASITMARLFVPKH